MKKHIVGALLSCAMLAAALTGCKSNASFTQFLGSAKAELTDLNDTVETDFELPYGKVAVDVALESGSVDIEIIDLELLGSDEDTTDYIELDTIFEAKDLAAGDHTSFTDDDGTFRLRITSSDGATGTINFSEG